MEEKFLAEFDGEVVEEFRRRHSGALTPEEMLMIAVMEDAFHMLSGDRKKKTYQRAREWILSDEITWPFDFRSICDAFGWEHTSIRKAGLTRKIMIGQRAHRGQRSSVSA
jgi:hypothetical protein